MPADTDLGIRTFPRACRAQKDDRESRTYLKGFFMCQSTNGPAFVSKILGGDRTSISVSTSQTIYRYGSSKLLGLWSDHVWGTAVEAKFCAHHSVMLCKCSDRWCDGCCVTKLPGAC